MFHGHAFAIGKRFSADAAAGVSYEAETTALVSRMTVAPDSTRQGHINTLIAALKTAGVWTKLDAFYALAAHDAQAARLNWKGTSFTATLTGAPTFTTDRGYNGFTAANYLNTGFDPATAGGLMTQDANHAAVFMQAIAAELSEAMMGNHQFSIGFNGSGNYATRCSNATAVSLAQATAIGHWGFSRISSTQYKRFVQGTATSTETQASAALTTANLLIGARSDGVGGVTAASNKRIGAVHFGGTLSDAEMLATRNAILAYMTAIGA